MDLTTYLREGHFQREIETLMDYPQKWELIYHVSGKRDITLVKEFQHKMLVEWIPSIKNYESSVRKSCDEENVIYGNSFHSYETYHHRDK
jgi:hypothetical protein